jgi:hypothetical protein
MTSMTSHGTLPSDILFLNQIVVPIIEMLPESEFGSISDESVIPSFGIPRS